MLFDIVFVFFSDFLANYFALSNFVSFSSHVSFSLVGCSRSATIVIAWMMREKQLGVEDAISLVKECRPRIRYYLLWHITFTRSTCVVLEEVPVV